MATDERRMTIDEYIRREDVIAWFMPYAHAGESIDADVVISDIKGMKAADVAPVRHGRWVDGRCSNCGVDIPTDDAHDAIFETECRFCYYCGAKMDGGDSDEAD